MANLIPDHSFQWWGDTEASFGAGGASNPAAGDAFDHLALDPGPASGKAIIPNAEKTGNRAFKPPIQGHFDPRPLSITVQARGSGTPTTPVDYAFLFKAAGFTETIGGSSVVYSRTLAPTTTAWLWGASAGGEMGISYAGVTVSPDIQTQADDVAALKFGASAAKMSVVYKATLDGALSASGTTVTLEADHGWVINGAPVYFQIDSTVYKGVSISGNAVTVSATVGTHSDGAAVTAYVPARTVASAAPISSAVCTFDLNAGAEPIDTLKFTVSVKTGMRHTDKEYGQTYRTGVIGERAGDDAVRYTADFYLSAGASSTAKVNGYYAGQTTKSVLAQIGSTSGDIIQFASTTALLVELNAPEADNGPRIGTMVWGGYSSTGADVTITTK